MPDDRLARAVRNLPAPWQGHYFEAVESTQDEAREAARHGAPDRSVFVSDFQRQGRGRHGRTWQARPGTALLASILFREVASSPWRFTRLTSLALARAIELEVPRANVAIKWPNDVMLDDRKVAGVLAEARWDGREVQAIVGVGVNVSAQPSDLSGVTSLQRISRTFTDRGDLLLTFLQHLDQLRTQPESEVHEQWETRLWRRGQRLRLLDREREEEVVILGAQIDGSLRVRDRDGSERITTTGELLA